jgi:hypothetical protein
LVVIVLLLLSACSGYQFQVPAETADGWQTASLSQVGLDEELLGQAIEGIENGRYPNVQSLLIVKGWLVGAGRVFFRPPPAARDDRRGLVRIAFL